MVINKRIYSITLVVYYSSKEKRTHPDSLNMYIFYENIVVMKIYFLNIFNFESYQRNIEEIT